MSKFITNPDSLKGKSIDAKSADFSSNIAFGDHKIKFAAQYCQNKSVLDIGCVQHNPENYESKYWLHKALKQVSSELIGIDLYEEGVQYLNNKGFNIIVADAQGFNLNRKFDIIVAGDLIEHLENFNGFLLSCIRHMHTKSRLLISTPNPWYWKNIMNAALNKEVNNNPEHTCWLCPRTLRQLVNRYGLDIEEITFGSRYLRDRVMPLPSGWKHTSYHVDIFISNN